MHGLGKRLTGSQGSIVSAEPLRPDGVALFLDLDGTLAPFESRPDLVGPDPMRTAMLRRLGARLGGRLAVLSGRTLDEIDRILDSAIPAAAGVHGLQRRTPDGQVASAPADPAVDAAEDAFRTFSQRTTALLVERKPQSVALHYRNAKDQAPAALALAEDFAARTGLFLQRGDMVAELRTPGFDKGDALAAFMSEPPFLGAAPVMVGDDLTDESAFEAARDLGGYGVLVGAPRVTGARERLPDVPSVLQWLAAAVESPAAQDPVEETRPWLV
jgi:trehalose 6-phosphate phosphatase